MVKNNQTNDFNDNIILNVQSLKINDNPTSNNHAANKEYVDNIITHESLCINTRHFNMNDYNITNIRFLGVNQKPQVDSHVVNLEYFNEKLDESTILTLNDDSNERYFAS